ncbi:putative esterase [Alloactinosynnema sp. L-07]|uniref:alpha/beta hydrolase n=1 Tax=Alloactinosynnema sp. L-07 TaxID=1653480 RepID=UPI00065F0A59|nr:alpha/beta hydrolase [Alloactinosynnema sp. L-07]CRK56717.1 putative esterase [Alloactinosynnema sp. L-07]
MIDTNDWRNWDQATLDRQYSPSSCVPSLAAYLDEYRELSAAARRDAMALTDLRYGPHPDETLDFFPARAPHASLQVFVHGGNWQDVTKDSSAFAAPAFLRAGAAFAAVGYGLAPAVGIDEIVAMVRRSLRWLRAHARELGFAPDRIHLTGTSAGAHLAAMAMIATRDVDIAGATLLSGMYDLEPVRNTYINRALGMDDSTALRNSPLHWLPPNLPPVVIARGGNETGEYIRQHDRMAAALRTRTRVTEVVAPNRDHFDLPYDLGVPGTRLGDAVLAQMMIPTPIGRTGAAAWTQQR